MPKLKSKSGIRKRFKITGTGKIKRSKAGASHLLTSKSQGRKRGLRHSALVSKSDVHRIKKFIVPCS